MGGRALPGTDHRPTPRPHHEGSAALWETTAAFEMERGLARMARNIEGVNPVAVGRRLCRRIRTPGAGHELRINRQLIEEDGST